MKQPNIDIWGKCPVCSDNWDKKKFSNITLVSYNNPTKDKAYKCPKCKTEWPTKEFKQSWK